MTASTMRTSGAARSASAQARTPARRRTSSTNWSRRGRRRSAPSTSASAPPPGERRCSWATIPARRLRSRCGSRRAADAHLFDRAVRVSAWRAAGTRLPKLTTGGPMANELQGKKIAFLATDMVEQVELTEPWQALEQAGAELELVSLEEGEIQGFNHYDKAGSFKVDKTVEEARASDYDGLVLPGGVGNPDNLRQNENAVAFVRDFFEQGKPVGAICHAPWTLVEAGVAP